MGGRLMAFGVGAAVGYVLVTRARHRWLDALARQGKRVLASDVVQEATGGVGTTPEQQYAELKVAAGR